MTTKVKRTKCSVCACNMTKSPRTRCYCSSCSGKSYVCRGCGREAKPTKPKGKK